MAYFFDDVGQLDADELDEAEEVQLFSSLCRRLQRGCRLTLLRATNPNQSFADQLNLLEFGVDALLGYPFCSQTAFLMFLFQWVLCCEPRKHAPCMPITQLNPRKRVIRCLRNISYAQTCEVHLLPPQ